MNILIFGANGYLGGYFKARYPEADTPSIDIGDQDAVSNTLDEYKPDVIINCAGKTGRPNVDWCEDHKEETLHSNVVGPLNLLEECMRRDIYFVHIGTGCIYSGDESQQFTEEDRPNFFGSYYSRTKGIVDLLLQDFPVLNVRLRMPFDGSDSERNLINKLKKYDRVLDQKNSMTYIPDLLDATSRLIEKRTTGTFNIVNTGSISPYEIMQMYTDIVDPNHQFEALSLSDLPDVTKAGRSNCVLSNEKLKSEGITLRPVEEAVKEALETLKSG